MYKFRAKSNIVLGVLSALSLLALIAVESNKVDEEQDYYTEKLEAAELTQLAATTLKNYRMNEGVFIDAVNDPNNTALIGQEYTLITTDRGYIEAKLSSTNPNFAAIVVQLLKEAGVGEKDNVAVAMTGSFPALNIAVMAALETLKAKPIVISSLGSSNWGANDPYFTWLDMENILFESKIFHSKSIAASIGGGADVGRGLSPEGRELILEAIERNNIPLIKKPHLEQSIAERMELYNKASAGNELKAFINIGGGIASIGNTVNGKIIPPGLTERLPMSNFPVRGVMIQMGQNEIPLIHLLNINKLLREYGLPESPVPLPEPGDGEIFIKKKYSVLITSIVVFVLLVIIILVYYMEQRSHKLGTDVVPQHASKKQKDDDGADALSL